MNTKTLELIHLLSIDGLGPKKSQYLFKLSLNFDSIWKISQESLIQAVGPQLAQDITQAKSSFNPDQIEVDLEQNQIKIISFLDSSFPQLLKQIPDYPLLLFAKGNTDILSSERICLGVVGSRKYSSYGQRVIEKIIPELCQANLVIVSGLALGIDALAHLEAVKAQGQTIAVLATGLDLIYPQENQRLAEQILTENGLIISEFPLKTLPHKGHFPRRNRIIAGISQGVLVVEANEKSGSLITASLALDYNRDVFTVPGDIFRPTSSGTNSLIQQGATLITQAQDVFDAWELKNPLHQKVLLQNNFSPNEKALLELMSGEPIQIEELTNKLNWPANVVIQIISQLELVGEIKNIGGGYYQKNN